MEKELKRKWVEDLRSDKYTQIKGVLSDGKVGRCCLGVLADVAGLEIEKDLNNAIIMEGRDQGYVPLRLLLGNGDKEKGDEIQVVLVSMNDGTWDHDLERKIDAKSFAKIADYIEQNL